MRWLHLQSCGHYRSHSSSHTWTYIPIRFVALAYLSRFTAIFSTHCLFFSFFDISLVPLQSQQIQLADRDQVQAPAAAAEPILADNEDAIVTEPVAVNNEEIDNPAATATSTASPRSTADDELLPLPDIGQQELRWSEQVLAQLRAVSDYDNDTVFHAEQTASRRGEAPALHHGQPRVPRHDPTACNPPTSDYLALYEDETSTSDAPVTERMFLKEQLFQESIRWEHRKSVNHIKKLMHYDNDDDRAPDLNPEDLSIQRRRYENYVYNRTSILPRRFHVYGTKGLYDLDRLRLWVRLGQNLNPRTPFPPGYRPISDA